MNVLDGLRDQMTQLARREARNAATVTDWGTVTVASPLEVKVGGDSDGQPVAKAASLTATLAVGDTVGLVRFGSRWYATEKLS